MADEAVAIRDLTFGYGGEPIFDGVDMDERHDRIADRFVDRFNGAYDADYVRSRFKLVLRRGRWHTSVPCRFRLPAFSVPTGVGTPHAWRVVSAPGRRTTDHALNTPFEVKPLRQASGRIFGRRSPGCA